MKICTKCGIEKAKTDYYKSARLQDGLRSACKSCANIETSNAKHKKLSQYNTYGKITYEKSRNRLWAWKTNMGCSCCDEKEAICLELHHKDPTLKEIAVGQLRHNKWGKIVEELIKCIVVCSNCHKKIHAGIIDDTNIPLITEDQCKQPDCD